MTFLGPAMLGMVTTIALMFALRPLAVSTGLIDSPGGRKSHIGDVPVIGGVAMFIGMIAGMAVVPDVSNVHLWMMFAGGVLLAIGIRDDRRHVSSNVRLVAQAMAAAIMALGANLVISDLGDPLGIGVVYLGSWATMFTVLVTISVINAFNFIDGIDGLAGCLAAIAIGAVAIVAVNLTTSVTTIGIIACASILGFLLFNFPVYMNRNVRSFMGDAGSTLLGLIVVWLTISVSQGEHRVISPVIGLWFVLVPLADLFTCFIRRILNGKSPLSPGREHLHYILMRGRLSV
jgi:UDP-GlcNAc:undecaprenyl-phosphate GlcNAc-1-phosphate transferase